MALQNDFLPFAASSGANVLTQAQYLALSTLIANGFSSGVATSGQVNKVLRQSSIMSAMLAQFISDGSGQTAIDDGTTATLEANLFAAVRSASRISPVANDTGAGNAFTATNVPPFTSLTAGSLQYLNVQHGNSGSATFAPDGLAAKPIIGPGGYALQGGELVPGGLALLLYSPLPYGTGAWILLDAYAGSSQVPPGTKSYHAVNLGQFSLLLAATSGYQKLPSGLIVQWGSALSDSTGTCVFTYPIAFPNTAIYCSVTYQTNAIQARMAVTGNVTVTSATGYVSNTSGAGVVGGTLMFLIFGY